MPLYGCLMHDMKKQEEGNGVVFHAVICEFGAISDSEMAEISEFTALPDNLTYSIITPIRWCTVCIDERILIESEILAKEKAAGYT